MRVLLLVLLVVVVLSLAVAVVALVVVVVVDSGSVNGTEMAGTTVKQVWVSLLLLGKDEGPPPPPPVALSRRPCHNLPTAAVARSPIRSKNARRDATVATGETPSGRNRTGARASPGPGADGCILVELVWLLVRDDNDDDAEDDADAASVEVACKTKAKLRL